MVSPLGRREQLACVRARGLRADWHVAGPANLSAALACQGCTGTRGDEGYLGAVPALWLSAHSCIFAPPRSRAELVTHASPVAPSGPAGALEALSQAHRLHTSTHRSKPIWFGLMTSSSTLRPPFDFVFCLHLSGPFPKFRTCAGFHWVNTDTHGGLAV